MLDRLLVLCWHSVEGTWASPVEPATGAEGLERQLRLLRRVARIVPLGDGLRMLRAGRLGPRAVALTFDDGYRDVLDAAVPVLRRLGLPATAFLVPGFLSGEDEAWWETLGWAFTATASSSVAWEGDTYPLGDRSERQASVRRVATRLKSLSRVERTTSIERLVDALAPEGSRPGRELFLDWEGARALAAAGVEVGAHSAHHAILSREAPEAQRSDLAGCRRRLEEGLGAEVRLLAYPNGAEHDYDATTIEAARDAGFSHAMTTRQGWNRAHTAPFEIRRLVASAARGPRGLASSLRAWLAPTASSSR